MSSGKRAPQPPLQNHRRLPHLDSPLHQPRPGRLLGRSSGAHRETAVDAEFPINRARHHWRRVRRPGSTQVERVDTTTHASFYLATFTIKSHCSADTLNPSATILFSGSGETAFAASNSVSQQLGPNVFLVATAPQIIQYEYGFTYPTAPQRRSLRLHHPHLDHRRPQPHRHLHRTEQFSTQERDSSRTLSHPTATASKGNKSDYN